MHLLKFGKWPFALLVLYLLFLNVDEASAKDESGLSGCRGLAFRSCQKNNRTNANPDPWFGKDKAKHFFASMVLTTLGYFSLKEPFDKSGNASLLFGTSFSLGAGVSKEFYDLESPKGHASCKDLAADLLGVGLAVLMIKVL